MISLNALDGMNKAGIEKVDFETKPHAFILYFSCVCMCNYI